MRILVTGATGQVGSALVGRLPASAKFLVADRTVLDLPVTLARRHVRRLAPEIIINCAAYTAVDKAEAEPALAMKVNAEALGALGAWAAAHEAPSFISRPITCSTARRAPQREDDAINPLSIYGKSKAGGGAAASRGRPLVVRTAWVYAAEGKNFLNTIARLAREKGKVARRRRPTRRADFRAADRRRGGRHAVRAWKPCGNAARTSAGLCIWALSAGDEAGTALPPRSSKASKARGVALVARTHRSDCQRGYHR